MTQARQKGSLRQSHGSAECWDNCSPWPHGGSMDGAWPERSLRYGRTKKINEVFKQRKDTVKMMTGKRGKTEKSDPKGKMGRRRDKKRDRKLYPLRGRTGVSDEEGLSCHVLLTRLEESMQNQDSSERQQKRVLKPKPKKGKSCQRKVAKSSPKNKSKANGPSDGEWVHVLQPRKRRLASLNAEAVNSLLLERATDPQPAAKQARRQEEPPSGGAPLDADPARSAVPGGPKPSRGNHSKALTPHKLELSQSSKPVKKAKVKRSNDSSSMSREILDAPAPRRLAGLNAAALLKLTSSSATSKQRIKAAPAAAAASDCKAPATVSAPKQPARVKHKGRCRKQKGKRVQHSGCTACRKKVDFEPKVEWETGGCTHRLTKPGYQSRSMLAYPLKQVKEEQLETELSPYYCCPTDGSVEYCHRLAFFLGQQPFKDSDDQSLNSALTPVKRECLVTSPSLTHSHPHAALALSPHPCLCTADHCFPGYYVHIAHPTHTRATSPTLNPRPLNYPPSSLCPNQMTGSKLLSPRVSHGSGLAHPAYCNSVASPCYGDACGISGYTYRTMPPVNSRPCSFSTGCTGCTHNIKTEGYSSPQGDHSPSLLASSSLPMSSCPLSSVPTSTQTNPHLLTPVSGQDQTPARLKLARECPKSTKPSNGSLSMGRTRLPQKQPPPLPSLGSTKQKKVSRRRATNGWRPVGMPTEREIFIAGEDESALRQCYEGVERDGEVIRVRDTVLLRSGPRKKSLPYVAKISALWEDPKTGELMMSLFWYYRPEHTQGGRDPSTHCENEIFASRHQDENSVACIEDRCYVLPLAQYCRFCALVKQRAEGAPPGSASVVPCRPDFAPPSHRCVPTDVDPELVYLCRHVYDFRYGRILKNLQ
ncbi:bromo adjacent homology domain-containing 1 protein-like [Betta splendens]|uniref:Bromo adjacent homology domain-containing 1 protein-like n=1 Tax=Betta splendens TaxID=158456 RepID=A0A6P7LPM0_BETSP|nr:bromo adjacent homology domain-containing 1 protein-like [Betta splendens]XP_028996795.1 bromo adjacent homology domain-containing 1 protein-like [Betta splendens]XP_028996796.1 bromo adjacent homology domain-containing 1 protein-like [Betta splendens]XP_028996797.1 bromo adjacent homology domain-containing 1 protein-like [Betta splendens]XP_055362368.1 bromo adjacent homology domain-containing 1 protein-like [Betta splendens]